VKNALDFQIHHVGISVPDLDAAIAWYENVLGFRLEQELTVDAIPARIAFVRRENFRIEIFEVGGAAPLPDDRRYPNRDLKTHGTKHFAFVVDDVDATVQELQTRGAEVAMHARIHGNPTAFIRDVAGNLIEFVQTSAFQNPNDQRQETRD
jgi:methylmalonyl-CoA/ethylmalonyl-CoA epimerase